MDCNIQLKIGALVTTYNQERFIKAHLEMLARHGDKIVVVFQEKSCPKHIIEHGVSEARDGTEIIARDFDFKEIEFHHTNLTAEHFEELNNEGAKHLLDCDIILRLDPDMFFTEKDFTKLITFISLGQYDYYRLNFRTNSINYYVTNRFDRGLKEALEEKEIIAFNPKVGYSYAGGGRQFIIEWPDFMLHHFRGWKKSTTDESIEKYHKEHPEYGDWVTAPLEIINLLK